MMRRAAYSAVKSAAMIAAASAIIALATRCSSRCDSTACPTDPGGWRGGDTLTMRYLNADTTLLRDAMLTVTTERGAAMPEMELRISLTAPDSTSTVDRFRFRAAAAEPHGRSMTTGIAPYRTDIHLGEEGVYTFRIWHENDTPLRGIRAVGIELKDNDNGKR